MGESLACTQTPQNIPRVMQKGGGDSRRLLRLPNFVLRDGGLWRFVVCIYDAMIDIAGCQVLDNPAYCMVKM